MGSIHKTDYEDVNRAFSKQATHYDEDDAGNVILTDWRQQVYEHVDRFLKPHSLILELNAGTGIDAAYFSRIGHRVHAIDIADGMIAELQKKVNQYPLQLTCQKLSFEELNKLFIQPVDFIFSNFGGLNCTDDLKKVAKYIPSLLKPGGYLTWVIMPPVSPWEVLWFFKGHGSKAFRRFNKKGNRAHLEGEYFQTYYHSATDIKKALGPSFKLIACEGLGIFSPPPASLRFAMQYPRLYRVMRNTEKRIQKLFPFNRCADHIILTFQKVN
ncbi:MAG TPA: class I SAM-dependent methyltransferase [Cyclobacteriaceae bacterium]